MSNDDLTIEILKQIRDEVKLTRTDLSARIDTTNERLDSTNERLDRVVKEQIRHATAIVGVERAVGRLDERVGGVEQGLVTLDKGLGTLDRRLTSLEQTVITEIRKLGDRIDNVLTGQLGQVVRATASRVDALEARMDRVEGR